MDISHNWIILKQYLHALTTYHLNMKWIISYGGVWSTALDQQHSEYGSNDRNKLTDSRETYSG